MITLLLPRGIRNNNPGNIRLSATEWLGQRRTATSDTSFAEFTEPVFGLRALMKLLLTYHTKYGLDTVESILNRYAPPHENDTGRYAFYVAKRMGVERQQALSLTAAPVLVALAKAIVLFENGKAPPDAPKDWYEETLYHHAAQLALFNKKETSPCKTS